VLPLYLGDLKRLRTNLWSSSEGVVGFEAVTLYSSHRAVSYQCVGDEETPFLVWRSSIVDTMSR
jgi:hypothetical protein